MPSKPTRIHSFKPIADAASRILILGSMPGPEALRRQEYYGFPGNHFWPILGELFNVKFRSYQDKIDLLKTEHIALWDVASNCLRAGAGDNTIRDVYPNSIPALLRKSPRIIAIFTNGRTSETLYRRFFGDPIKIPQFYLPSTSPAHASISFKQKLQTWSAIKGYLSNRNPWC